MIAMAMAWNPNVLIADEITSNLDVTLQADVLDRLKWLRVEKRSAIMLITHDMAVIAQVAENVTVMYAGYVVESTPTPAAYSNPTTIATHGHFCSPFRDWTIPVAECTPYAAHPRTS